jgi:hypothetical protein
MIYIKQETINFIKIKISNSRERTNILTQESIAQKVFKRNGFAQSQNLFFSCHTLLEECRCLAIFL